MHSRPLRDPLRVVSVLPVVVYGVLLAAGIGFGWDGLSTVGGRLRLMGLVSGCLMLALVEVIDHARARSTAWKTGALVARLGLFALVAVCDSSGVSRSVLVIVPFLATLVLGVWRGVAFTVGALAVIAATLAISPPGYAAGPIPDALMLGIGILLAVTMAATAREAQRSRSQVADLAANAERLRLARELHDSVGHHLTAVSLQLDKAASFRQRDSHIADQAVESARASARSALQDVRLSVRSLREHAPTFSLDEALSELVQRLREDHVEVFLTVTGAERDIDAATRATLFRAAQEALTNIRRHSNAARVDLALTFGPSATVLTVRDDGVGFQAADVQGFGLVGMRERAVLVGGEVDVFSTPGGGTTVTVAVAR